MTSLSDSQNCALQQGEAAAVPLPANSPIQACAICEALIDISDREPLEQIGCPHCGADLVVRGQIDHYQLVEVAGRGGMGVVYKGYDPGLDRYVALKLLRRDHSHQSELIAQLENEAGITATVSDPYVVRVYSTGTDRGRFYIAMELVDKGSLDDLIRLQGRVSEAQTLEVGIHIAKGLRTALQHGLIHRDVKPGNILFADARTAKIVDFGLAIFMEQEESVRGEIWGTPYYVAPEKLDAQAEDFRSDIYSLGATLFHALAGRPPFEAESATLVALKHLKSQPVSIATYAPWVSGATAFVINRTLQKNPADRYQSYDELIEHLEYALSELHKAAAQRQPRARVVLETEEDQKHTGWVMMAMLAIVLLLACGLFTFRKELFRNDQLGPPAKTAAQSSGAASATATSTGTASRFAFTDEVGYLAARDPGAAAAFHKAGAREKLSATDRAWAALFEGAAELDAGNAPAARAAFQQVQSLATKTGNEKLTSFFIGTVARLVPDSPIAPADARDIDRTSHDSLALLLYGLKNWQLGKYDEAVSLLRQFRSATPAGNAAWIAALKPLATAHIEEFTDFQMRSDAVKAASDGFTRIEAIEALRKIGGRFAARTEEIIAPYAAELAKYRETLNTVPSDGTYTLINRNSGKCVDVDGGPAGAGLNEDANVHQWSNIDAPNQQWRLMTVGGGWHKLVAVHSGKALDVDNARSEDGVNVRQHEDNNSPAQHWRIEPAGDGFFKLIAECSRKVLAVDQASRDEGANIFQWSDIGSPDQQWRFVRVPIGITKAP
jgi:hypothetical protein